MKNLLFTLLLLPVMGYSQSIELGANIGNIQSLTASFNLRHIKFGVGYDRAVKEQFNSPFIFIDLYHKIGRSQISAGVQYGNYVYRPVDNSAFGQSFTGKEYGFNIGYSYRVYRRFHLNAQCGYIHGDIPINDTYPNNGSESTHITKYITIGLHYLIKIGANQKP